MKTTYNFLFITFLISSLFSCQGQNNLSPEQATSIPENDDFIFIGMPKNVNAVDTCEAWNQEGQKILITGTIYKNDGKTPAPDVILYYYHTNINGQYPRREGYHKSVAAHGYMKGWVKTGADGRYAIYTVKPQSYPNSDIPAHIHPYIKEPNMEKSYYIDDFFFDDDTLLTGAYRKNMENRGGTGVLRLLQGDGLQIGERDIILGLNMPDYPNAIPQELESGKNIGEDVLSFTPYHAWGPDKSSKTCPICKYGRYHGILYFVGNQPNWADIKTWLSYLEAESFKRKKYLKAYFIYGNEHDVQQENSVKMLEKIGKDLNLKQVALTVVPSFEDEKSEVNLMKINPEVENTFLIYKHSNIVDKFINLSPTSMNFELISRRLDETQNDYFYLKKAE